MIACNYFISNLDNVFMKQPIFTKRETEVLQLICLGHTNTQIAKILNISISTAKVHVASIFQKLGVNNRILAVVKYLKSSKNFEI